MDSFKEATGLIEDDFDIDLIIETVNIESGADGYLNKPFRNTELVHTLRKATRTY